MQKFVHVDCRRGQERVVQRAMEEQREPEGGDTGLPHGLSANTLKDYSVEWSRYVEFVEMQGIKNVPGRDSKWDMPMLWEYMRMRSARCKPTTVVQIATKLRHFGMQHGFVLATSKYDAQPAVYGAIKKMKKQLTIEARERAAAEGRTYEEVERCTPLGKRSVEMLLSGFGVVSEEAFRALSRSNRHHVFATMMQHTGGMRFGLIFERDYTTEAFVRDARDGSFRLVTDYSRYAGRRQFCINFEASPRYESMWYHVHDASGTLRLVLSAATLMSWHFDMLQRAGERHVFRPVRGGAISRQKRQVWLRQALLDALPLHERAARSLIDDVTPHSFRAGIAGDLYREGIALQTVGSICRWRSPYAIRIYSERPCMSLSRTSDAFRTITGRRG